MKARSFAKSALLVALVVFTARTAAAQSCEALSSLKLPDATITLAQPVAAGAFTPPAGGRGGGAQFTDLPAFCRVAATLKPSADSDIKIEVWLPAAGWNGKFQATGNGGWNGNIDTNALATGVRRGYVTASTDTGHQGGGGPWMQNREKLIDYGHRAVHEMTVKGKAIAAAFYGNQPRLSYFTGCSAGGRQALVAAQRYPEDFDGIVAGAPALNATGRAVFAMYVAQNLHKDEAAYIPATKYPAIHDAVLQACDAVDGVKDRVIENPTKCTFDPKVLACSGADSATCLTPPQVEAARKMYQAVVNTQTKKEVFPGLAYGSELGWATFGAPQPFGIGTQMFQFMVFNNPELGLQDAEFRQRHGARGQGGGRSHQRAQHRSEEVHGARRQAHSVSRVGRPADSRAKQHAVLPERRGRDGREDGDGQLSPVHGARHESLWRRPRHDDVRHAHRARAVGGEEAGAGLDSRVTRDRRARRSHAPAVPVSAGRDLQGIRKHRRSREFRLQIDLFRSGRGSGS